MSDEATTPLISMAEFRKSGRCPVSLAHLLNAERGAMLEFGAIIPFGRRYLVDEARFFEYLRERDNDN